MVEPRYFENYETHILEDFQQGKNFGNLAEVSASTEPPILIINFEKMRIKFPHRNFCTMA